MPFYPPESFVPLSRPVYFYPDLDSFSSCLSFRRSDEAREAVTSKHEDDSCGGDTSCKDLSRDAQSKNDCGLCESSRTILVTALSLMNTEYA